MSRQWYSSPSATAAFRRTTAVCQRPFCSIACSTAALPVCSILSTQLQHTESKGITQACGRQARQESNGQKRLIRSRIQLACVVVLALQRMKVLLSKVLQAPRQMGRFVITCADTLETSLTELTTRHVRSFVCKRHSSKHGTTHSMLARQFGHA